MNCFVEYYIRLLLVYFLFIMPLSLLVFAPITKAWRQTLKLLALSLYSCFYIDVITYPHRLWMQCNVQNLNIAMENDFLSKKKSSQI